MAKPIFSAKLMILLLSVTLLLLIPALPVTADDGSILLSSAGAGSPDVEVGNNGEFVALVYYKLEAGGGAVYLKSTEATNGWRTRSLPLGFTTESPKLAFSGNSTVFVVWVDSFSGNTAVKYAKCTLSASAPPDCGTVGTVQSNENYGYSSPDVVINGSNGDVYVAWTNTTLNRIEVARLAGGAGSWSIVNYFTPPGGQQYSVPVLGWSSTRIHLAYLHNNGGNNEAEVIRYHNSTDGNTWPHRKDYEIGQEIAGGYDYLSNPAVIASGTDVYLAWDTHKTSSPTDYGLMRAMSATSGDSGWSNKPTHITSDADGGLVTDNKLSKTSGPPGQEVAIRPSLAISGTGFAVLWQQRPSTQCGEGNNGTFEINYGYNNGSSWNSPYAFDDTANATSIDPDIAVQGSTMHAAFMKDTGPLISCDGDAGRYAIYYRGPFKITVNDGGEGGGIYLPLIMKFAS